jgi:hypothetical protein
MEYFAWKRTIIFTTTAAPLQTVIGKSIAVLTRTLAEEDVARLVIVILTMIVFPNIVAILIVNARSPAA